MWYPRAGDGTFVSVVHQCLQYGCICFGSANPLRWIRTIAGPFARTSDSGADFDVRAFDQRAVLN